MKYLKLFENFEDIHKICKKYGIEDYTINPDGSIDVDGNVYLYGKKLDKLPLTFNDVSGYFDCSNNNLTTLEGAPKSVGGYFSCSDNNLTTLLGGPQSVVGDFDCRFNNLTTLEGCPQSIGGSLWCQSNKILTFEGAPNHVGGVFNCNTNPIFNIWDLFKDYSKVELLNDLDPIRGEDILMDRLNTFLSMIGLDEVESVKGYNCIN